MATLAQSQGKASLFTLTDITRDAGIAFTSMTQERAEAIVKDLIAAGEVQTEQAQAMVLELVDRSRKNTEKLLAQVRTEVREQIKRLGLVSE